MPNTIGCVPLILPAKDNRLLYGHLHTVLSDGDNVLAAGQMVVGKGGKIEYLDNISGHYRLNMLEGLRNVDILKGLGLRFGGTRLKVSKWSVHIQEYVEVINRIL